MNNNIWFMGDPHGDFKSLLREAPKHQPDAVILLGDYNLEQPFHEVLSPLLKRTKIYFIHGNHDCDQQHWFNHAFHSTLSVNNIHAKVVTVNGIRIAGLGGVFRGDVWYPEQGKDTNARYSSYQHMQKTMPHNKQHKENLMRKHCCTIFPDDIKALSKQRADILVTHEAPSSHRHGFAELDLLARAMGVKLIFHGHHHLDYTAQLGSGIRVEGVGLSGLKNLNGDIISAGRPSKRRKK